MRTLMCPLAAALMVAGCATTDVPVGDVRLVSQAFDNLNAASQPLLDELAVAERAQGKAAAEFRARRHATGTGGVDGNDPCPKIVLLNGIPPIQDGFCAADSDYYSEIADPPGTRAFRQALAATGDYTRLLVILAEDRNLDEAMGQLASLASHLGQAAASAGAAGAGPLLNGLLQAFSPVLEQAGRRANTQELKRLVVQESPKVQALVAQLRSQSDAFFKTLSEAPMARYNLALDNVESSRNEAAKVEAYRVAVSNYVVLLDQYKDLLGYLVQVYEAPRGSLTLAELNARSARLSAQAEAWRRSLAGLRAGLR